jgi:hypothetical protein
MLFTNELDFHNFSNIEEDRYLIDQSNKSYSIVIQNRNIKQCKFNRIWLTTIENGQSVRNRKGCEKASFLILKILLQC